MNIIIIEFNNTYNYLYHWLQGKQGVLFVLLILWILAIIFYNFFHNKKKNLKEYDNNNKDNPNIRNTVGRERIVLGDFFGFIFGTLKFFIDRIICYYLFQPVFLFPFSLLLTLLVYTYLPKESRSDNIIILITFFGILWTGRETMVSRQVQQKVGEFKQKSLIFKLNKAIDSNISLLDTFKLDNTDNEEFKKNLDYMPVLPFTNYINDYEGIEDLESRYFEINRIKDLIDYSNRVIGDVKRGKAGTEDAEYLKKQLLKLRDYLLSQKSNS